MVDTKQLFHTPENLFFLVKRSLWGVTFFLFLLFPKFLVAQITLDTISPDKQTLIQVNIPDFLISFTLNIPSSVMPVTDVYTPLGTMAGEVSQNSIILHARLCETDTIVGNQLLGKEAWARFEIANNPNFTGSAFSAWKQTAEPTDYISKERFNGLFSNTRYYYRLQYGLNTTITTHTPTASFKTLPDITNTDEVHFVASSCINHRKFYAGNGSIAAASGQDSILGYPGMERILQLNPDFWISNGDNVYYDNSPRVTTIEEMRYKWHRNFIMPRFRDLSQHIPSYWLKDDHDFRRDDADLSGTYFPSAALGISTFREQIPIVDLTDPSTKTYRTYRINKHLQIWMLEGRDHRDDNSLPNDSNKSLWGDTQKDWLKNSMLVSDATFKIIITATPMIGPDKGYKSDNHANPLGFQTEGEEIFNWLATNGFDDEKTFFVCGDRHWQYHMKHSSGFEEFSSGALTDQNAGYGIAPGYGTDPDALITEIYLARQRYGGFLDVRVRELACCIQAVFTLYDNDGNIRHQVIKGCEPQLVELQAKVILQGAFDDTAGAMDDNLRTESLIPEIDPYGSGKSIIGQDFVLAEKGVNSIVDWVQIELRDKLDPSIIIATHSALVQKDGDIVDVDGAYPIKIPCINSGEYHIAVRHRNHLGVMTQVPIQID